MNPTQPADLVEVTPAVTLRGAALYLRRHGWRQGDMFDLSVPEIAFPPACGLGAIRMALTGDAEIGADSWPTETVEDFDKAVMAFADHLFTWYDQPDPTAPTTGWNEMPPWPEQIVADWNDDNSRNVSQVIAALNGAADQWDNRHGIPACCGEPMSEKTPDVWVFPGDPVVVERMYHCPYCDRQERVEVTDTAEKDRLFSEVACGDLDGGA
jgi:hypothetical protein